MSSEEHEDIEIKQVRREKRLRKKREQIKKHGKSLFMIYQNVTLKRLQNRKVKK